MQVLSVNMAADSRARSPVKTARAKGSPPDGPPHAFLFPPSDLRRRHRRQGLRPGPGPIRAGRHPAGGTSSRGTARARLRAADLCPQCRLPAVARYPASLAADAARAHRADPGDAHPRRWCATGLRHPRHARRGPGLDGRVRHHRGRARPGAALRTPGRHRPRPGQSDQPSAGRLGLAGEDPRRPHAARRSADRRRRRAQPGAPGLGHRDGHARLHAARHRRQPTLRRAARGDRLPDLRRRWRAGAAAAGFAARSAPGLAGLVGTRGSGRRAARAAARGAGAACGSSSAGAAGAASRPAAAHRHRVGLAPAATNRPPHRGGRPGAHRRCRAPGASAGWPGTEPRPAGCAGACPRSAAARRGSGSGRCAPAAALCPRPRGTGAGPGRHHRCARPAVWRPQPGARAAARPGPARDQCPATRPAVAHPVCFGPSLSSVLSRRFDEQINRRSTPCCVANPRHSFGYGCGLRLAWRRSRPI